MFWGPIWAHRQKEFPLAEFGYNNNLFLSGQYGLRNNRSTTLVINNLMDLVVNGLEQGLDTYASFFDLCKAFDCVSHTILLKKLEHYNFSTVSLALIESYLSCCTQFVYFNSKKSSTFAIDIGVPQGLVLVLNLYQ